jgi:hypothetical protein
MGDVSRICQHPVYRLISMSSTQASNIAASVEKTMPATSQ